MLVACSTINCTNKKGYSIIQVKMKKYFVYILALLVYLVSCDDSTGTLGSSVVPDSDVITVDTSFFEATSKSIIGDSVLAKTSKVYLGRFTDPQTNLVLESSFIAQFNCEEGGNVFPENTTAEDVVKVELRLFFSNYFGDPTTHMTAEVYELSETLQEGERYYTTIVPEHFYDASEALLATKVFTITDYTLEDSELNDSEHYSNVIIPLPKEVGEEFVTKYIEDPEYFSNASNFIENVCQGYYVKASRGDGAILYVDQAVLNIHFKKHGSDSILVTQFAGTEEVLQTSIFKTKGLDLLAEDGSCTYLRTPAGLFTEVELPVEEILEGNDSINAAKITFNCYYDDNDSEYKFGTPQTLLMVHKDEMYSFFEKNKLTDDISSFYTTYNSTYNCYEYDNIARLIAYCSEQRDKSKDWNKVVLIPVTAIIDSNNYVVNFRHDFTLNSVRLVGGKDKIKIRVVTSKIH